MSMRIAPFLIAVVLPLSAAMAEQQADETSRAAAPSVGRPAGDVLSTSPATSPATSGPITASDGSQAAAAEQGAQVILDAVPGGRSEPDPLTPAAVNQPSPNAPGAPQPTGIGTHASPAVVDPILISVRARLIASDGEGSKPAKADEAGLAQFYAASDAPVWTGRNGLTDKGRQALAELAKADDWGLDRAKFAIPDMPPSGASADVLAAVEIAIGRAVLTYARHARGGRIDPESLSSMFDRKPAIYDPKTVLAGVAAAPAADRYLQSLHPQNRQFALLRQALVGLKAPKSDEAPVVRIPDGPSLKAGEKHPHVALLRKRLKVTDTAGEDAQSYDEKLVAAVEAFQRDNGLSVDGIVGSGTRDALNGTVGGTSAERRRLLIANMERWRWMPDKLGDLHVWNNIPEQMSRVIEGTKVVFSEKIVVGKPATPTANFSADMKFVIFNPTWGVPNGIKTNELAPMLRRTTNNDDWFFGGSGRSASSVLNRVGGLQVSIGGRPVNPDTVDWSRIDIRRVSFTQPAGGRNVLGVVKFRFPNKHDIYMHDTPERHLFSNGVRAFSHGCMRVQNPLRLAEVLLERDKGWSAAKVRSYVAGSSTHDVLLSRPVPVHVVYFTAVAAEDGKVRMLRDLYGVDGRVASALEGRQVRVAAAAEPAVTATERRSKKQRKRRSGSAQSSAGNAPARNSNPFASVFAN